MGNLNEQEPEVYANDYPLERIFHNAAARVLDFLILNQQLSFTAEEISSQTETPERTLQRVLPFLAEEEKLIIREREGLAFKYEINLESERTRALVQYVKATVRANLRDKRIFPTRPDRKQKALTDGINN